MTDVPAYVYQPQIVVNQVVVTGGNNWDVSRHAVPTPIAPAQDAARSGIAVDQAAYARVGVDAPITRLSFTYAAGAVRPVARLERALSNMNGEGTWVVRIERGTHKAETAELQAERLALVREALSERAGQGFIAEVVPGKGTQSRLVLQQLR